MKHVWIVLPLIVVSTANAAFERVNQGSRAVAMGGAHVTLRGNEWSAFSNPAALKTLTDRTLALSYAPQIFEMKELSQAAASYVEPTSIGAFALSASRFGLTLHRESRIAISYGDEIANGIAIGISLNYYSLSVQNYGSAGTFGADVGVIMSVTDEVQWGFAAFNLNAPTIGVAKEKLPQTFSTGVAYSPYKEATLAASLSKDLRYPVEVSLGVEYEFIDMIAIRAGTTGEPSTLNAGMGIRYSLVRLDYAFSSHNELGITHNFSLTLNVGEL